MFWKSRSREKFSTCAYKMLVSRIVPLVDTDFLALLDSNFLSRAKGFRELPPKTDSPIARREKGFETRVQKKEKREKKRKKKRRSSSERPRRKIRDRFHDRHRPARLMSNKRARMISERVRLLPHTTASQTLPQTRSCGIRVA